MNQEAKISMLQNLYIALIADAVRNYSRTGVMQEVARLKYAEQMSQGPDMAKRMQISSPRQAFEKIAGVVECAKWKIVEEANGFVATAESCKLAPLCKYLKTESPCAMYCLNPLKGIIKGLEPQAEFLVEKTMWDSDHCRVRVMMP